MLSKHLFKKAKNTGNGVATPPAESKTRKLLGLRQCAEPDDSSRAVDIVFVHGLTGDREKTWTYLSNDCFWPEKLLPSDLPDARVLTYGYDADVAHFFSPASQSRIGDHAQTLLGTLAQFRERTETSDRPLFFVAHSLGGLVVEDMLLHAKNSAEPYFGKVSKSTRGICFMGTPHCGSRLADWAKVLSSVAKLVKNMNESIIGVLQPQSEVLARIQQDFHAMILARIDQGKHKLRVTCFFEDHDMPGIGSIVPKDSAKLVGYISISIPSDHMGMTKFPDATDVGYQRVSSELCIWARDVNRTVEGTNPRVPSVSPNHQPNSRRLPLENGSSNFSGRHCYQGSMSNVGQVFQGSSIGTFQSGRP